MNKLFVFIVGTLIILGVTTCNAQEAVNLDTIILAPEKIYSKVGEQMMEKHIVYSYIDVAKVTADIASAEAEKAKITENYQKALSGIQQTIDNGNALLANADELGVTAKAEVVEAPVAEKLE